MPLPLYHENGLKNEHLDLAFWNLEFGLCKFEFWNIH